VTDLALSLHDLPASVVSEILSILQKNTRACAAVIVFTRGEVTVGEITVPDTEANLHAKVTALDSEGHETTFDATPTWESSDDTVAKVSASADGYTATFEIGAPGSAIITVTGIENSSGTDVEIVSTGLINVTGGDAVVGSVEFAVEAP
jgi:hypothetical protein